MLAKVNPYTFSHENPNLEFMTGDVNTLSFQRFEIVTLIDLLSHMPYLEQEAFLKESTRSWSQGTF
jgi:hypothetical protein